MNLRALACSGSTLGQHQPCCFQIEDHILLDMGAGASKLTIAEQLKVQDIILSHPHLDHVKDLAFFAENIYSGHTQAVRVHASGPTIEKLSAHLFNNAIWPDFTRIPTPERPILRFQKFSDGQTFSIGALKVTPIPVNHPGGCHGFVFESSHGALVYSGDTGVTQDLWRAVSALKNLKVVLIECSFPNRLEDLAHLSGHLTPKLLADTLSHIPQKDALIYAYHIKAPYLDEVTRELHAVNDARLRVLLPGMRLSF